MIRGLILVFCSVLLVSCDSNSEEKGAQIILKSIEVHGGQEGFRNLKSISFYKTTRLFSEDGSLESESLQKQSFQFQPNYLVNISWEEQDAKHQITYDRKEVVKMVNETIIKDAATIEKALQTALSAEYVFFQPFDLLNNDAQLSYAGTQMLRDSLKTSVVNVRYKNDTAESDIWNYYFDKEYRLVGASVEHNNRISLIENLEFQTHHGLLFNRHRKSYFVDSLLRKKYLRAEYFYEIIE